MVSDISIVTLALYILAGHLIRFRSYSQPGPDEIIMLFSGWPNALAIDFYTDKLYFGDAKLDYIAVTNLDGQNRKMVLNTGVNHIYSLAVYENAIFWSDWGYKRIKRADKYTGANIKVLATLIHRPMSKL